MGKVLGIVVCPYCGFKNTLCVEHSTGFKTFYCSTKNGGCEKPFTVRYKVALETKTFEIMEVKDLKDRTL